LLTFVLAVLALFLVPGPAVLLTLTQSMMGGRRVGMATSLGIALGDAVHTIMAVLGLSAVLMTSAAAFSLVKYAGAAYLLYVGVRAWIKPSASIAPTDVQPVDTHSAFHQALLTEVLNPRTALFFLAFLPQFVYPAYGPVPLQLLMLGLIFVMLSIGYTSLLVLAAGSLGPWLMHHAGIARWQGKVTGSVYIGLGIRLALQQRG
jgi:threonine/homoserine/homoserine lactone efflux protein